MEMNSHSLSILISTSLKDCMYNSKDLQEKNIMCTVKDKINQGINQSVMAQRDARCQKAKTQLQLCSTLLENNCYKSFTFVSQPCCMKQHLFRLEGIKNTFSFSLQKYSEYGSSSGF